MHPLPSSNTQAHDVLAAKLAAALPQTKEEAEIASITAAAIAGLATANKTRVEMIDNRSTGTRVQRWVQFAVGVVGLSGTLAGVAGTIYYWEKFRTEEKALGEKRLELGKAESQLVGLEEKKETAQKHIASAKELREALDLKVEMTQTKLVPLEKELADRLVELEKAREQGTQQSEKTKEIIDQRDQVQKELADLRAALEDVKKAKPREFAVVAAESTSVAEAAGGGGGRSPASVDDDAARAEVTPLVEDLFSQQPGLRGNAYRKLTSAMYRTTKVLPEVLLRTGRQKLQEYSNLESVSDTPERRKEQFRLRRGLENTAVTLRDISRSVTQEPEERKDDVLKFAAELLAVGYGTKEEAESLQKWIRSPR